jgi:hypothetical protein
MRIGARQQGESQGSDSFLALWSLERVSEYDILNIIFATGMAIPTSSS